MSITSAILVLALFITASFAVVQAEDSNADVANIILTIETQIKKGELEKAQSIATNALLSNPASHDLHRILGSVYTSRGQYDSAVACFQRAIELRPDDALSYHGCALAQFTKGDNTFWGVYDAEIYINLASDSEQAREFSKDLVAVYKKNIVFQEGGPSITFCADIAVDADGTTRRYKETKHEKPYGYAGFELPVAYASMRYTHIDLETLFYIRVGQLILYDTLEVEKQYGPNVIMSYLRRIKDAGHIMPYTLWLFDRVWPDEVRRLIQQNPTAYQEFLSWKKSNPLVVNKETAFLRKNYD